MSVEVPLQVTQSPFNVTAPTPATAWTCPARAATSITLAANVTGPGVTGDDVSVDPRCVKGAFNPDTGVVTFTCPNVAAPSTFTVGVAKYGGWRGTWARCMWRRGKGWGAALARS